MSEMKQYRLVVAEQRSHGGIPIREKNGHREFHFRSTTLIETDADLSEWIGSLIEVVPYPQSIAPVAVPVVTVAETVPPIDTPDEQIDDALGEADDPAVAADLAEDDGVPVDPPEQAEEMTEDVASVEDGLTASQMDTTILSRSVVELEFELDEENDVERLKYLLTVETRKGGQKAIKARIRELETSTDPVDE